MFAMCELHRGHHLVDCPLFSFSSSTYGQVTRLSKLENALSCFSRCASKVSVGIYIGFCAILNPR